MKKTLFLIILFFFIKNLSCFSNKLFDLEKLNTYIDFNNQFFRAEVNLNDKLISLDIAFLFHKKANQIIANEMECNKDNANIKRRKFLSLMFSNISFSIDSLGEIYMHDGSTDLSVMFSNNCKKELYSKIRIKNQRLTFLIMTTNKTWFYFDFYKNRLNTISSNNLYNEIVIKTSKEKSNNYRYLISSKYSAENFMRYSVARQN
jgi:uncharacterized protein YxeA